MEKELESIFRIVAEIKKDWKYGNEGEAFAHLFVKKYLSIDDSEAAEACQVGFAGHDRGIDAFYVEEDTDTIFVFGITSKSKSLGPEILTEIDRAHNFLSADELEKNVKNDLKQAWISYRDWKNEGFAVTYVRGMLGELNKEAKEMLEKLASKLEKDGWTIEVSEEQDTLNICLPMISAKGPNAEFEILDEQPLVGGSKEFPRATVFSVKGSDLAEVVLKNRSKIFELNLRETLTSKNPVNKKIAESLANPDSQGLFWYLNLGVDAVCDRFESFSQRKPGEKRLGVKITNFRIVNGCQTCITLTENLAASKNVSVMVRLVETKNRELGYRIAVAKNRQTAIRERDLVALEPKQLSIQADMASFSPPFFYQRREGEWRSKEKAADRRRFGKRMIDNKLFAKAYLATFLQKPFEAKHKTKIHFQQGEGGLYETIFHPKLENRDLIVADEVYEVVREQNKKQRKEYRELVKESANRKLSEEEEKKLKKLSYLVNADTYIAALVWHLSDKFLKPNIDKQLISLERPLNTIKKNNLVRLYEIACRPIESLLTAEESVREDQGLSFSIRNYFAAPKTYKKLQSQADSQIDGDEVLRVLSA